MTNSEFRGFMERMDKATDGVYKVVFAYSQAIGKTAEGAKGEAEKVTQILDLWSIYQESQFKLTQADKKQVQRSLLDEAKDDFKPKVTKQIDGSFSEHWS